MDIDLDRGASYGKTIFWNSTAQVPPYLRLANVQFDIDAEKFYKIYIDLMTRPPRSAHQHTGALRQVDPSAISGTPRHGILAGIYDNATRNNPPTH